MKNFWKKIYCSKPFAYMVHKFILFLYYTNRREIIGKEILEKVILEGKPAIGCFWHGRLLPMPLIMSDRSKLAAIVSRHTDGEFLANIMNILGVHAIRGSSNRVKTENKGSKDRGGTTVVRETIENIQRGNSIVITPDGPKGPRMRVKDNIFRIAHKTGAPIITMAYSATNSIVFNSWDKFMLPLPFGKMVFKISEPFYIPESWTEEEIKSAGKIIENNLNQITEEVDLLCNRTPILPE